MRDHCTGDRLERDLGFSCVLVIQQERLLLGKCHSQILPLAPEVLQRFLDDRPAQLLDGQIRLAKAVSIEGAVHEDRRRRAAENDVVHRLRTPLTQSAR